MQQARQGEGPPFFSSFPFTPLAWCSTSSSRPVYLTIPTTAPMTTAAPATSCKQLDISPHIFPLHVLSLCFYPGTISASKWLNARRRYHRDTDESTSAFGCGSEKSSRSGIFEALANAHAVACRVLREILTLRRSFTGSAKACTFKMGKRHVDIMSRNFQRLHNLLRDEQA